MKKKNLVILGHPDTESICGSLAKTYIEGAKTTGIDGRELKLGDLNFEPILWKGYNKIQELEPDLVKASELIQRSNQ